MIVIRVLDLDKDREFTKTFDDADEARAFCIKVSHSDHLSTITASGFNSLEEMDYVFNV